ncbi:MAG: AAA family ATPase, partial [Candidatus Omnitrophica bacterium]|nr:AAA family ATPase [Candidatus Omnitrophota bacterium]
WVPEPSSGDYVNFQPNAVPEKPDLTEFKKEYMGTVTGYANFSQGYATGPQKTIEDDEEQMAKAFPFKAVSQEILNQLNNGYTGTTTRLAMNVGQVVGTSNTTRIKVMITTLVESGVIEGYGRGLNHRIKGLKSGAGPAAEAELDKLKDEVTKWKNERNDFKDKYDEERKKEKEKIIEVHVKAPRKRTKKIKEIFHKEFETLVTLAQARKNIFLYGPTGSGKTFICGQVARAIDLRYRFVSCTSGMSEGVLQGRRLPGKQGSFEYNISEFVDCYENGGVFLLDEMDAADANVLLLINAALANGEMAVPNRSEKPRAKRHNDFICIAAANTVGTGGDRLYAGRNQLDASTLDRFHIGKVYIDYDPHVEEQLCPDEELREKLWKIRAGINAHRLERAMSTRFMQDAYQMQDEFGWDFNQIMKGFFQGWRGDERNKVLTYVQQN